MTEVAPLEPVMECDPNGNGLIVFAIGDDVVWVVPMVYNDRIVIGHAKSEWYDHGWCYDKGGAAILAALVWDPRVQDEPVGFKKRVISASIRVAPRVLE